MSTGQFIALPPPMPGELPMGLVAAPPGPPIGAPVPPPGAPPALPAGSPPQGTPLAIGETQPPTSAPEPAAPVPLPQTVAEAKAEIHQRQGDKSFLDIYHNASADRHTDAVARMTALFRIANGETVASPEPVEPPTPDQLQALQAVEHQLGSRWESRLEAARQWLGPEVLEAVEEAGFGDDPEALEQLCALAESDPDGAMWASLRDYLGKGVYYGAAKLERLRLEADPKSSAAYYNADDLGHAFAMSQRQALFILETPPAFLVQAMQKLGAPA